MTIRETHKRMDALNLNQPVLDLITPDSQRSEKQKAVEKPLEFNSFADALKAAYEGDEIMVNRLGEIVKKKG